MSIQQITTDFTGQVGVKPRIVRIYTTDSFATVTAANYLQNAIAMGFVFEPSDLVALTYGNNISQLFTLSISGSTITLIPSSGDVILPVVDGNFAVFSGTSGNIDDRGFLPSDNTKTKVVMASGATVVNEIPVAADVAGTIMSSAGVTATTGSSLQANGNIIAGKSGTAGLFASFPSAATSGALRLIGAANAADVFVDIENRSHAQATTYLIADVGQVTGSLLNCRVAADPASNLIWFDITVGQAALASGGSVTLYASSGSKQYKVRNLIINKGGTNFSGGGGDRLGQITDGTTVYSVIPATNLQTLVNSVWGASTPLPLPASVAANTSTAAGASLVFKYSGGATDYTAGSIVVSGVLERVA